MKLEDIKQLIDSATPGPWWDYPDYEVFGPDKGKWKGSPIYAGKEKVEFYWDLKNIIGTYDYEEGGVTSLEADAKFICAMRELAPKMLAVCEAAASALSEEAVRECLLSYNMGVELIARLEALENT